MSGIVVSQLGARQRYMIPMAFYQAGILKALITDFWSPFGLKGQKIAKAIHNNLFMRMASRWDFDLPSSLIHSYNLFGIQMAMALKKEQDSKKKSRVIAAFGKEFSKRVASEIQNVEHNVFFGYCSESLESIVAEKSKGSCTILDQYDAANDEYLFLEESERWPGWGTNYERATEYYERVYKEWELADIILVNSAWAKTNIIQQGASPEKIRVVAQPYLPFKIDSKPFLNSKKLRVIYVGGVNLRKGVQYLLAAAERLNKYDIEFIVVGGIDFSSEKMSTFPSNVVFTGHIPFPKVREYYLASDLFVFPTLSDGFGTVQLEAMNFGIPVIATTNCGDVVENGKNGFIVPIRDPEAIVNSILTFYENRDLLVEMGNNAYRTVYNYSMEKFVDSLEIL